MSPALKDRFIAFSVHLSLSGLIALGVIALVFWLWYPAPLHRALGVVDIFLLLLFVDVCLGPLLTAAVYKKGKRGLLLDLSVIAFFQLAALAYGLYTLSEARPGWLVFGSYHFELVKVSDVEPAARTRAPWTGPLWVAIPNAEELKKIPGVDLEDDPYYQPVAYVPLEKHTEELKARALKLKVLYSKNNSAEQVDAVLKQWPQADAWVPLRGREKDMVVLLQRDKAQVVAIVDLSPWF